MLPLAVWPDIARQGIKPGSGDEMIRFGTLKALADNSLMFEPFADKPNYAGGWSFRTRDEADLKQLIIDADRAGYDLGVHVLGDKAVHFLVDSYQAAIDRNGPRDRRMRAIHVWYSTPQDLQRIGRMHLIADITPSHLTHEWRTVESALGPQRSESAHAWRTLLDSGAVVNIVSDMPGGFTKGNMSPFNPFENLYYATTRKDRSGQPRNGWHPEQRLTIEQAIRAYTLNPAYSSREDAIKGSIEAGKLADLVVASKDVLTAPPEDLLATEAVMTVLGGKVVFEKR
jgi:predicted amidohydrolase YtcJ